MTPKACHAAGMTLPEAVQATGLARKYLYNWAYKQKLDWPAPIAGSDVVAPPDQALADADLAQCLALWRAVLAEQWWAVFSPGAKDTAGQIEALRWFGSSDCATVCALAGIDPEFVMRRFHALRAQTRSGLRVFRRKVTR